MGQTCTLCNPILIVMGMSDGLITDGVEKAGLSVKSYAQPSGGTKPGEGSVRPQVISNSRFEGGLVTVPNRTTMV